MLYTSYPPYRLKDRHFKVVHKMRGRIRLRSAFFRHPQLHTQFVEASLEAIPGILHARINPRAGTLVLRHDGIAHLKDKVLTALINLPPKAFEAQPVKAQRISRTAVGLHLFVAASTSVSFLAPPVLRLPLVLLVGLPVLFDGIRNLFKCGLTAKSLDAASLGLCLFMRDLRAVSLIAFLRILGDYLKQANEDRSSDLLKNLFHFQHRMVWVEREGVEIEQPYQDVRIGDTVVCRTGELVAVDGIVLSGQALLNKSCINGESVPVPVVEGDNVVSGSVVESGRLKIMATQVGEATSLARINQFLERTLQDKSLPELRGEVLADRLVPLTLAIGAGAYVRTADLARTASMLSIDYVCSVKFPATVSVKSSLYASGKSGMLLKGGSALDALARVDAVVFDKTGTLTRHRLRVTDIIPANGTSPGELLQLAARMEQHCDHPLAKAILAEARTCSMDLPPVREADFCVSRGVRALVDGEPARIGSLKHMDCVEDFSRNMEMTADLLRSQGKMVLYVARGESQRGLIALQGEIRPDAQATLRELRALGIKNITVLTGDHHTSSQRLLARLEGIDRIHAELGPDDKARIVRELQAQGHCVAVVGDGVNDAPAFVCADLGICMTRGADLAQVAAQAVILDDDLQALCAAVRIARRQHAILNHCYNQGLIVNSLLLLLAACGALTPFAAATLHNANTFGLMGYAALAAGKPTRQPDSA